MASVTAIYLDVDEVLVDWVGGALRLLGYDPEYVHERWSVLSPRPWDLFEVVDADPATAWEAIHAAGPQFWAQLDDYPWASDLLALCNETAETTLLTSPSKDPASYAGKREWIQRRFGDDFDGYAFTRAKHRFAHPGAVLIDDSPRNCERFVVRGGRAIVFPGVGNSLFWVPPERRVAYVRDMLAVEVRS